MTSRRNKSKRRSGTRTKLPPAKQLESYTFFVDRSLGSDVVPESLRKEGLNIKRHKDHFVHNAEDVVWLAECGQRGWVVLHKDRAISSNEAERIALFNAGVAAFVLTSVNTTGEENAAAYIKALDKIARFLKNQQRPFIARVSAEGNVSMWIDSSGKDRMKAHQERRRKQNERRSKRKQS